MQTNNPAELPDNRHLEIRPYREEDWPALCRVHDAARLQELAPSVGVEAFQSLDEVGVSEGLFDGVVEVGVVGGCIVGFVAYLPDELTWLYVDPSCQKRGIGRTLLRHALAQTDAQVSTQVLVGNDTALNLYLSEGFVIVERREGKLSGNPAFEAAGNLLCWNRSSN